jgi:predicted Zn-dependent peptidase
VDAGTTAILVEDHRAPLVFLRVELPAGRWSAWVAGGPVREAFQIQPFDDGGELRREADRLSMELDLVVGRRSSVLAASFHRDDLGPALALVRELLLGRAFDRAELKRKRRARQVGWASVLRDPSFRARQAEARLLFASGDPRRMEFENPPDLVTDRERLLEARDLLVRLPGRVIGLAGDVRRGDVEKLLPGLLPAPLGEEDDLPDLTSHFASVVPPAKRGGDITVEMPELTQVYFRFVRESLPLTDPDYPAFLLADHVLGGHFFSRLSVALRHEGGETYGAGTEYRARIATGPYSLWTFTRADNAAAVEAKLRRVLADLRENGITEEERSEAAGFLLGQQPFRRQSPDQVLRRHLRERRLGLPPGMLEDVEARAAALPLDTVNAFARRFYDPAQFTMVKVVPGKGSRKARRP